MEIIIPYAVCYLFVAELIFLHLHFRFKTNDLVPKLAVLATQFLATKTLRCLTGKILHLQNRSHILLYIFLFAQNTHVLTYSG